MASLCQVTIWFGSDFCGLLCPLLLRQAAYLFAFPTFFTSVEAVMLCLNFLFSARLSWISSLLCCIFKLIWEQHDLDQATSRLPVPLAAGSRGVRSGVLKFSATYLMACVHLYCDQIALINLIACSISWFAANQSWSFYIPLCCDYTVDYFVSGVFHLVERQSEGWWFSEISYVAAVVSPSTWKMISQVSRVSVSQKCSIHKHIHGRKSTTKDLNRRGKNSSLELIHIHTTKTQAHPPVQSRISSLSHVKMVTPSRLQ